MGRIESLLATVWFTVLLCDVCHASKIVPGRAFDRFISIWLENQDYAEVILNAEFLDLKRHGISQTRYFAQTHPSQPNYLASVAGDYFGLNHDGFVTIPENVSTIVDLLEPKEISWTGYYENTSGPGFLGMGSTDRHDGLWYYVRKHNHFASFDSISHNGTRLLNLMDFNDFDRHFKKKIVPQFVMMSPNMNNDGHNTTLEYATKWAHNYLKPMLADNAFKEKTIIQLTYDESADYHKPNRIVSLLLGNGIPQHLRGTEDHDFYTHYSILSTMQNNWELPNLGRYDVGANVFGLVANKTGWANKDPPNATAVDNSISYPGFLNSHPPKQTGIPPVNLKVKGAGGNGISDVVRAKWNDVKDATPYQENGKVFDGDHHLPEYLPQ